MAIKNPLCNLSKDTGNTDMYMRVCVCMYNAMGKKRNNACVIYDCNFMKIKYIIIISENKA